MLELNKKIINTKYDTQKNERDLCKNIWGINQQGNLYHETNQKNIRRNKQTKGCNRKNQRRTLEEKIDE